VSSSTDDRTAATPTSTQDPSRWIALAVIGVAQLMIILDATIVNVALALTQIRIGSGRQPRAWRSYQGGRSSDDRAEPGDGLGVRRIDDPGDGLHRQAMG
jgi:hypothetical protein